MFRSEDWDLVHQTLSANINSLVSLRDRMAKRLKAANVTGLLLACFVGNSLSINFFLLFYKKICFRNLNFGGRFFQTKLLSRLLHKVCRRLSSPVLLRKFTIVRVLRQRVKSYKVCCIRRLRLCKLFPRMISH